MCSITFFPATFRNCLGRSRPKRDPLPPANITAIFLLITLYFFQLFRHLMPALCLLCGMASRFFFSAGCHPALKFALTVLTISCKRSIWSMWSCHFFILRLGDYGTFKVSKSQNLILFFRTRCSKIER